MDSRFAAHFYDPASEQYYRLRMDPCSASFVSTNATADDLPGPGRTLGVLHDFVGGHIETGINRLAEMLGKGPQKTAVRIERRRSKAVQLPAGSRKAASKDKKVKKDCKKLVKYISSDIETNRNQALDQVTRLAIQDKFVRDVLLHVGAERTVENVRNSFLSVLTPTLHSRSSKALFSLIDTEINVLGQELLALARSDETHYTYFCVTDATELRHLEGYLDDSDRVFLVIRHVYRILDLLWQRSMGVCPIGLLTFLRRRSILDNIEWNVVDQAIVRSLSSSLRLLQQVCLDCHLNNALHIFLENVLRFAERLPMTVKSDFFYWFSSFDTTEYGVDVSHIVLTRELLRGIAIANNLEMNDGMLSDLSSLQIMYPHPALKSLLRRLTCPPEVQFRRLAAFRYNLYYFQWGSPKCKPSLVTSATFLTFVTWEYFEELENSCIQLGRYLDSEDEVMRMRAQNTLKHLLSWDVYSRRVSLRALLTTRFSRTHDCQLLLEASVTKCIPSEEVDDTRWPNTDSVIRHCDKDGKLLYLSENMWCCDELEGTKQSLTLCHKDVLKLRIPRGTAFCTAGFYPIFTGITEGGEKAYLARPMSRLYSYGAYIAITEGTKPDDLRMRELRKGRKVVPAYLDVFVLRYAPDDYMRCERFKNTEPGMDATGPFSWKPWHAPSCTCGKCVPRRDTVTSKENVSATRIMRRRRAARR